MNSRSTRKFTDTSPYRYAWMTPSEIRPYIRDMEDLEVSVKARTSGFLYNYLKTGTPQKLIHKESDQEGLTWGQKRNLFIRRTLAAYKKDPTIRRKLSLIAWAYDPN